MLWWEAGLWALAGGFVVEGLEFSSLWNQHRCWPWQFNRETGAGSSSSDVESSAAAAYFIAKSVRLISGGILGAAFAGQVVGPLPALAVGAVAPALANQLRSFLPAAATAALSEPPVEAVPPVAPPSRPVRPTQTKPATPRARSVADKPGSRRGSA